MNQPAPAILLKNAVITGKLRESGKILLVLPKVNEVCSIISIQKIEYLNENIRIGIWY